MIRRALVLWFVVVVVIAGASSPVRGEIVGSVNQTIPMPPPPDFGGDDAIVTTIFLPQVQGESVSQKRDRQIAFWFISGSGGVEISHDLFTGRVYPSRQSLTRIEANLDSRLVRFWRPDGSVVDVVDIPWWIRVSEEYQLCYLKPSGWQCQPDSDTVLTWGS